MRFPAFDHVLLLGGAPLLVQLADLCQKRGLRYHIWTAPRQAEESIGPQGETLAAVLSAKGHSFRISADINAEPDFLSSITPKTLGLGLGEAWTFDATVRSKFAGNLLDIMGIPLPRYRGGAHYTWMILRGERSMAVHLQEVTANTVQGVSDDGRLIASHHYTFSPQVRTPQDYFDAAVIEEAAFIGRFFDACQKGADFQEKIIDESTSLYLPRLKTVLHGWIDWHWSGQEIERFIAAFDTPYPGASTECAGRVIRCKSARLITGEGPFHPFQSGLITRTLPQGGVLVATTDGLLEISKIIQPDESPRLRQGDRLWTPSARLEAAMLANITYGT